MKYSVMMRRRGGGSVHCRREISNFRAALEELELRDLPHVGQWYTWEHGQSPETRIRERLDRFLA